MSRNVGPHVIGVLLLTLLTAGRVAGQPPDDNFFPFPSGAESFDPSAVLSAADDAGMPDDPEFRSALVAYLEWGTRLAVANSAEGATPIPRAPVPRWGWGEAPPYQP